jgi:hypothetical protein
VGPLTDPIRDKAIYLDQRFYELIVKHCRAESGTYSVLREMALLKYKSPAIIVANDRLEALDQELVNLERARMSHSQIAELRYWCEKSMSDKRVLTISADMYQEL